MSSDSLGEELSCTWRLNTISGKQSKSKTAMTLAVRVSMELFVIKSKQNKTVSLCPATEVFFSIFPGTFAPCCPSPTREHSLGCKTCWKDKVRQHFWGKPVVLKTWIIIRFWETAHASPKPLRLGKTVKNTMQLRFWQDFSFDYGNTIGFHLQIILL